MTLLTLALAAALAVVCVVYVAAPFLREPETADDRLDELGELERRRAELAEERDRALAALKELEFDHRAGTVSDEDYRALVGPLRRRAADALRRLQAPGETAGAREPAPPVGSRDAPVRARFQVGDERRSSAHDSPR